MYKTFDAVNSGTYFWRAIVDVWPLPVDATKRDHAVLSFDEHGLFVIVDRYERVNDSIELGVSFTNREEKVLLTALLSSDFEFINGEALGLALDEVGAVDHVNLLMPHIGGIWHIAEVTDDVADDAEEEDDHV